MAQIPLTFRAQKNLLLDIGPDTFEMHVSSIEWVPSSSPISWHGGTPDAIATDAGAETWLTNWLVAQDWENPDSLCNFLLENAGTQVEVTYKPEATGDFGITATITLVSPRIGGAVNAFNESAVSMASTKPANIPIVP